MPENVHARGPAASAWKTWRYLKAGVIFTDLMALDTSPRALTLT